MQKKQNKINEYKEVFDKLHRNGILTFTGLMFGLDEDRITSYNVCYTKLLRLAVMVVAKEIYTVIGAGVLYLSGNLSIGIPSLWGKLSTLVQILTICLALISAFRTVSADP